MDELKPANQHPDFGKICSHGQLKRKCYTCELEDEIESLKAVNKESREKLESMRKLLTGDLGNAGSGLAESEERGEND